MRYRSLIHQAGVADAQNRIYSQEALEKMVEENDLLEIEGDKVYISVECKLPDPEAQMILNDNIWDLI